MDVVNNESYIVADFFNLSEDYSQSFDWVVEHTFFCAITPDLKTELCKKFSEHAKA